METRRKGLSVAFLLFVAFFLSSSQASAAYFYDWSSAQKVNKFKESDNLKFQASMNHGKTLEWRVKDGEGAKHIGNSFTWWAGPLLPGEGSAKKTYDLASATVTLRPTATPIPSAAWLLASGVLALIGLKRRNRKKDR